MGNTKNRNVRIEDEIWDNAAKAAKANGENVSVVIRRALIQYARWNEATFTAEIVEAGQEPTGIPDGSDGGHFRIPRGNPAANRSDEEQS